MGDSKIVNRGTVNRIEKGLTVTRALKVQTLQSSVDLN